MAFNSPRDLLMALLATKSPRELLAVNSPRDMLQPPSGQYSEYSPVGQAPIPNMGPQQTSQYIGLGDQVGGRRGGGGGQSNQAKISIALPASKLFETDSSGGPSVGPMSPNLPYPNVGQTPGALGYTPVGQMGPSYTPYDPNSERPFYSQMRGK